MSACAEYLYEYQNTYMVDLSRSDEWSQAREENTPLGPSTPFYTPRTHYAWPDVTRSMTSFVVAPVYTHIAGKIMTSHRHTERQHTYRSPVGW